MGFSKNLFFLSKNVRTLKSFDIEISINNNGLLRTFYFFQFIYLVITKLLIPFTQKGEYSNSKPCVMGGLIEISVNTISRQTDNN